MAGHRIEVPVDLQDLREFAELLDRAQAQRHRLPTHLLRRCYLIAETGGAFEVISDGPGLVATLTPEGAALAAILRAAL